MQKKHPKSLSLRNHHLLSVNEAADYLGISTRSVRRHIANGDLTHERVGWLIKFKQTDLDAFVVRVERRMARNGGRP